MHSVNSIYSCQTELYYCGTCIKKISNKLCFWYTINKSSDQKCIFQYNIPRFNMKYIEKHLLIDVFKKKNLNKVLYLRAMTVIEPR